MVLLLAPILGVAGLTLSGCGNSDAARAEKLEPVKGKVLLTDSSPLTAGHVVLVAASGSQYAGEIGADGSFEIKTSYGDGAPVGTYRVRIDPDITKLPTKGKTSSRNAGASLKFPVKYTDESTSELTATIKPGENNLEPFKLSPESSSRSAGKG